MVETSDRRYIKRACFWAGPFAIEPILCQCCGRVLRFGGALEYLCYRLPPVADALELVGNGDQPVVASDLGCLSKGKPRSCTTERYVSALHSISAR